MAPDPNFWCGLIKDLRAEQRMSQQELATRANVNRTTLRRIEEGKTSPNMEIFERLLSALGHDLAVYSRREGKLAVHRDLSPVGESPCGQGRRPARRPSDKALGD